MKPIKIKEGYSRLGNKNLKLSKVLEITEYKNVLFDDYVLNFSNLPIIKDNKIFEYIADKTFKIAGIYYGDDPSHYIELKDKNVKVAFNGIIEGVVLNLGINKNLNSNTKVLPNVKKTYVMVDTLNNYYKIGRSNDPCYRENTLQSEKPTVELYLICDLDFEKQLHEKFKNKRIRGEWFNLDENDIQIIISDYNFQKIKK